MTLPDLDHLIALYEEWLAAPPAHAGQMHIETMLERLNHARARRDDATRQLAPAA